MNSSPNRSALPSPAADLARLDGRIVLVKSARDHRNPQTGMRGTIEVRETPGERPRVSLVIEFPQMFTMRAHRRTIPLDDAGVARLLECDYNGTFEFTLDEELEPGAPQNE